jgi:hypothetical protein
MMGQLFGISGDLMVTCQHYQTEQSGIRSLRVFKIFGIGFGVGLPVRCIQHAQKSFSMFASLVVGQY